MSHMVTLNLSDEAYDELLRAARDRDQSPESVASRILDDSLSDPLLRLSGCIESPVTDLSERHDEYLGQELLATHDE
jgi:hypothetical protein